MNRVCLIPIGKNKGKFMGKAELMADVTMRMGDLHYRVVDDVLKLIEKHVPDDPVHESVLRQAVLDEFIRAGVIVKMATQVGGTFHVESTKTKRYEYDFVTQEHVRRYAESGWRVVCTSDDKNFNGYVMGREVRE